MISIEAWPHYISEYGYIAIFLLAIIEGPIVTIFASFLASQGVFDLPAVYATVIVGDLVGDSVCYVIGRWGLARLALPGISRWPSLRRRTEVVVAQLRFKPGRVLLFGKLTHSAGLGILLAAGAARIRFDRFLLYNLLGTMLKSAALVAIGYWFGQFYKTLNGSIQLISVIMLVLLMVVITYILHRWSNSSQQPQ